MKKIATIETARGAIKLELYYDKAPKTVANFEKLANSKFYFHNSKNLNVIGVL